MDIILWIVLGAIAGWIASIVMKSDHGVLTDVIIGIVGALIGGFLMNLLGSPGVTGFNLYSLLVSVVGSVVLIWISRRVYH